MNTIDFRVPEKLEERVETYVRQYHRGLIDHKEFRGYLRGVRHTLILLGFNDNSVEEWMGSVRKYYREKARSSYSYRE